MSKQCYERRKANRWEFYSMAAYAQQAPVLKKRRQELEDRVIQIKVQIETLKKQEDNFLDICDCKHEIADNRKRIAHIAHYSDTERDLNLYGESEIITGFLSENIDPAKVLDCEDAFDVCSKNGFLSICMFPGVTIVYPKFDVPDGNYSVYLTLHDAMINEIHDASEDVSIYYRKNRNFNETDSCEYCNSVGPTAFLRFVFPETVKKYGESRCEELQVSVCPLCINDPTCEFDSLIRSSQKYYNNCMLYPVILPQLLYARARLTDNPFHADNLPLDIFKIIMRLVFPASFLTIK